MADGGKRDRFDRLVLDDDFVKSAVVVEGDAERRVRAAAKANPERQRERREFRRARRRRRLASLFSYRTGAVVAALVLVGLVVPGFNSVGPLAYLGDLITPEEGSEDTSVLGASATAEGGPTTTIDQHLYARDYKKGDCVWWDESNTTARTLASKVVDCNEPHLLEITGRHVVKLHDIVYPKESYWVELLRTGPCLAAAEKYMGTKLDPDGNYYSSGVYPTEEGWILGDRTVHCGIAVHPYEAAAVRTTGLSESTGRVAAEQQHRIYPVGACLGDLDRDGEKVYGVVPCDAPHDDEVSGHVDLGGRTAKVPASDEYEGLVGDDCDRITAAFLGRPVRGAIQVGWHPIESGSWDAGRRTVICTVGEYRDGARVTRTTTLRG